MRRNLWLIAAVVLMAAAFVLGRVTAPEHVPESAAEQGAVPVFRERTEAGAASAAHAFQTAGYRVAAGTLDAEEASRELLAVGADDPARRALGQGGSRTASWAGLSTAVVAFSPERAEVLLWGVAVLSVGEAAPVEDWGRVTVTVVWEGERWRVVGLRFEPGPWPARAGVRFTAPEGDFSFRSGGVEGWLHVGP